MRYYVPIRRRDPSCLLARHHDAQSWQVSGKGRMELKPCTFQVGPWTQVKTRSRLEYMTGLSSENIWPIRDNHCEHPGPQVLSDQIGIMSALIDTREAQESKTSDETTRVVTLIDKYSEIRSEIGRCPSSSRRASCPTSPRCKGSQEIPETACVLDPLCTVSNTSLKKEGSRVYFQATEKDVIGSLSLLSLSITG